MDDISDKKYYCIARDVDLESWCEKMLGESTPEGRWMKFGSFIIMDEKGFAVFSLSH